MRVRCFHIPALLLLAFGSCGSETTRPSILLITIDTLRADALGAYGNETARTPALDRLASQGVTYLRAWTSCPLTLPSHATILTGRLPPEHGLRDNAPPRALPPPEFRSFETLAETLSGEGYSTAAFVSASVLAARTGLNQGFDHYDCPEEGDPGELRYVERVGEETVLLASEWLRQSSEPTFLWVHLFDPHEPYAPPIAFRSADAPDRRTAYSDEVAYADYCVGELLQTLEDAGRSDTTLVIVTADHGEGLGDHGEDTHGYLLHETTVRVPLIVRWPGRVEAGRLRPDPVSLAQLAPAVLDRKSPFLTGSETPIFSETLYGYRHMGWAQMLATVSGARKLIEGPEAQLFDLAKDPGELNPGSQAPADLVEHLSSYRSLSRLTEPAGDLLHPLVGLPYAGSVGRGRLTLLTSEENRELPKPDPALAGRLDAAKTLVAAGKHDEARVALLHLQTRDPGNPTIPFWLGRNAMISRDHALAAREFSRAWENGLQEARTLSLWIQQLLLAGGADEAGRIIELHANEVVPETGLELMIGAWHLEQDEVAEAARRLARAEGLARSERDRKLVSRFRHNLGSRNEK